MFPQSRRHRDATPYFDDESHRLWSSDAAELMEGETVDAHVIQHHGETGREAKTNTTRFAPLHYLNKEMDKLFLSCSLLTG